MKKLSILVFVSIRSFTVLFLDQGRNHARYLLRLIKSNLGFHNGPAVLVVRLGKADLKKYPVSGERELELEELQEHILGFIQERPGAPIHFWALENGNDERLLPLVRFAHRLGVPIILSVLTFPKDAISELLDMNIDRIEIWMGGISDVSHRSVFGQPVEPTLRLIQELAAQTKQKTNEYGASKKFLESSLLNRTTSKLRNSVILSAHISSVHLVQACASTIDPDQKALLSYAQELGIEFRFAHLNHNFNEELLDNGAIFQGERGMAGYLRTELTSKGEWKNAFFTGFSWRKDDFFGRIESNLLHRCISHRN